jgi:hypothetical protein
MANKTIKLDGVDYTIGTIDTITQFQVARRLGPVLAIFGESVRDGISRARSLLKPNSGEKLDDQMLNIELSPLAKALADMKDQDANYILGACLNVCHRKVEPQGWAPVIVEGSGTDGSKPRLMFPDIQLNTLMGLVVHTLQENLMGFFTTVPPSSPDGTQPT